MIKLKFAFCWFGFGDGRCLCTILFRLPCVFGEEEEEEAWGNTSLVLFVFGTRRTEERPRGDGDGLHVCIGPEMGKSCELLIM